MYKQLRLILFGALLLVVVTIMGSTTVFAATTTPSTVASTASSAQLARSAGTLAPQSRGDYRAGYYDGCSWGYNDWRHGRSDDWRRHWRHHDGRDYDNGWQDGYREGYHRHHRCR